MFVIDQSATFKHPVTFKTPKEEGGHQENSFTCEFRRLSTSELDDLTKKESLTDKQFAKAVVAGWSDIKDKNDNELPFNDVNLNRLLDIIGVATIISLAYREALTDAPRKN